VNNVWDINSKLMVESIINVTLEASKLLEFLGLTLAGMKIYLLR
jgi:hypothetical protein